MRPQIKELVEDLQKLRGTESYAVWPTQKNHRALYYKLYRVKADYKKAIGNKASNNFTIADLRLLSCVVGARGPIDQALGLNMLGGIETVAGRTRWTFKPLTTTVSGEWHDTEAAAVADLERVQSMLFPPDLPEEDWFDQKRRATHLQRVKSSAGKAKVHEGFAIAKAAPHRPTHLAYPHDSRTLQNDLPGFSNLGNTCYLNAVLQCVFNCEPLASDLFTPQRNSGIVESALRALLAEYIASGVSTAHVISPIAVLHEVQRHTGFTLGRQHDAAECLRQLLRYTRLGERLCDSQADVVDGSVVICYTPEAAQVSVAAAAVDAHALLIVAATGDRSLKVAPQALAIRIENTYEQGGFSVCVFFFCIFVEGLRGEARGAPWASFFSCPTISSDGLLSQSAITKQIQTARRAVPTACSLNQKKTIQIKNTIKEIHIRARWRGLLGGCASELAQYVLYADG